MTSSPPRSNGLREALLRDIDHFLEDRGVKTMFTNE